jgi:hypothetical protein
LRMQANQAALAALDDAKRLVGGSVQAIGCQEEQSRRGSAAGRARVG